MPNMQQALFQYLFYALQLVDLLLDDIHYLVVVRIEAGLFNGNKFVYSIVQIYVIFLRVWK